MAGQPQTQDWVTTDKLVDSLPNLGEWVVQKLAPPGQHKREENHSNKKCGILQKGPGTPTPGSEAHIAVITSMF